MRFRCGSGAVQCGSVAVQLNFVWAGFVGLDEFCWVFWVRFSCGSGAVQLRFSAVQCGSVRFMRFVRLGAVHAVHAVGLRLGAVVVLVSPIYFATYFEF